MSLNRFKEKYAATTLFFAWAYVFMSADPGANGGLATPVDGFCDQSALAAGSILSNLHG